MRKTKVSILLLASILSNAGFAAVNFEPQAAKPSMTFWGMGGDQIIGSGQGLIPFGGDGVKSTFYGAVEAAGSFKESNGYTAGVAAGYRKIINNSYILGGYIFADYNRSPEGYNFLVVNPGFEALGDIWDFRANGYIPTTCRHWVGSETFAENIGITKFEEAFGHTRYDHLFQRYEEVGPGVDVEVGRLIPIPKTHDLRAYVGGYHYFMDKTDKITGVEGRMVYPMTKYISLEARDSYDKVRKNAFMFGVRLTFGGASASGEDKENLGVFGRLSDPIEHNFGNIASANSVAVGKGYLDKGAQYRLPGSFWYYDNAASASSYINSNVSSGDGSYEHPFTAIDQRAYQLMTNSGALSQNVQMYIATGISPYDLNSFSDHRLSLLSGYSIYGRTTHFTLAAAGSQRPELDGGITAFGGNSINDIQIKSENQDFGNHGALYLFGDKFFNKVNINDVNINVSENRTDAFGIGVMNTYATINNSQIIVSATTQSKQSMGIGGMDNSALFVGNNNFIHATINSTGLGENHAAGIAGNSPVIIYGNNNQIIADAAGNESRAIGVFAINNMIAVFGNNNQIMANAAGYDSRAGGIISVGTTLITGNNNQISGNVTGIESKALGIANIKIEDYDKKIDTIGGDKKVIIAGNNNQIIANSAESNAVGIVNFGGALTILGNNNQIIANSANHVANRECNTAGIAELLGGTTTISGVNNLITVNSAKNAYGIFLDPLVNAPILDIKNTIFNISAVGEGSRAVGISEALETNASKITLRGNTFNVAASGAGSKAYGFFLASPSTNTLTLAPVATIEENIFNVTNPSDSQNAWGVYANSNWGGVSAAWIRAHNTWINPTSRTPQQQVYTGGTGFVSDYNESVAIRNQS
ncbi:MAG: inverse autotransporter beta domain-containing protein [Gammaproteobacteria bacterium]|nr:inverse autotransporter beta domain-containing protein [Gammaproteobacteria bacterium]